jgi:hypothetical protein
MTAAAAAAIDQSSIGTGNRLRHRRPNHLVATNMRPYRHCTTCHHLRIGDSISGVHFFCPAATRINNYIVRIFRRRRAAAIDSLRIARRYQPDHRGRPYLSHRCVVSLLPMPSAGPAEEHQRNQQSSCSVNFI